LWEVIEPVIPNPIATQRFDQTRLGRGQKFREHDDMWPGSVASMRAVEISRSRPGLILSRVLGGLPLDCFDRSPGCRRRGL
jgi:hypothetical protein